MQRIFVSMLYFSFWLSCLPGLTHADNSDPIMVSALVKAASKAPVATQSTLDPAAEAPVKNNNQKHQWSWKKRIIVTAGTLILVACGALVWQWPTLKANREKGLKMQGGIEEQAQVMPRFAHQDVIDLSQIGLYENFLSRYVNGSIELLKFIEAYKKVGLSISDMQDSTTIRTFIDMISKQSSKKTQSNQDVAKKSTNLLDLMVAEIAKQRGDIKKPTKEMLERARKIKQANNVHNGAQEFLQQWGFSELKQSFNQAQNIKVLKIGQYCTMGPISIELIKLKETHFLKPIIDVISKPNEERQIMAKALEGFADIAETSRTTFDIHIAENLEDNKQVSEFIFNFQPPKTPLTK
jgi:hypothetical protein